MSYPKNVKKLSSSDDKVDRSKWGRIYFRSALAFYLGCVAITIGVLLHIPMFLMGRNTGYKLVGMPLSNGMLFGMFLIVAGIILSFWGVLPPAGRIKMSHDQTLLRNKMISNAPLSLYHWELMIALGIGLLIDFMKPMTLSFVLPGTKTEYGLTNWGLAFLPLLAFTGMVIGALFWGRLGDYIGRRACILLSGLIFMATSICGAMPAFGWNIGMCFLMGASSAGMIPVAASLISEVLPTKHRGNMLIVLGGIGTVGGYLAASGTAALLEPTFGWRILWFLGLPTGLLLILLNHYIPESPRFLLEQGRTEEADRILHDFDMIPSSYTEPLVALAKPNPLINQVGIFHAPYISRSLTIILYGVSAGLISFCFLLWLPSNLRSAGLSVGASNIILAKSALIAFPSIPIVAWLYSRWSSRKTLILFSLLSVLSLFGFILFSKYMTSEHTGLLTFMLIALLCSSTGMITALLPYSVEIYPTRMRATGSGLGAASSKIGGLLGISAVLSHFAPTLITSAFIVVIPIIVSIFVISITGIETHARSLEEITEPSDDNKFR